MTGLIAVVVLANLPVLYGSAQRELAPTLGAACRCRWC
ncbi:multidrug efflux system integral membrane protein [Bordetella pertussis]|nr:multidrug efflux system integral membrane protein [Bordetella pertussis]